MTNDDALAAAAHDRSALLAQRDTLAEKLEKAIVALKTISHMTGRHAPLLTAEDVRKFADEQINSANRPDGINISVAPNGRARPATPPPGPPNKPARSCPYCSGPANGGNCDQCIPY